MTKLTVEPTTIHHEHDWIASPPDRPESNIELAIGYIEAEIERLKGILQCLKNSQTFQ